MTLPPMARRPAEPPAVAAQGRAARGPHPELVLRVRVRLASGDVDARAANSAVRSDHGGPTGPLRTP